jgi:hypothetical protein
LPPTAQQAQLWQYHQRLERQSQRLLDAYQAEIIGLEERQSRRGKLLAEVPQIEPERQQLAPTPQPTLQWQPVIEQADTCRQLLGDNLGRLSFADRQAGVQCLISTVVVPGEPVDIAYALPCVFTPQKRHSPTDAAEGPPGHVYRLRLADFYCPPPSIHIDYLPSGHCGEVGHQDFCLFRPIITPLLA